MKQSQLQLIKYFFPTINITADPDHKIKEKRAFSVAIEVKLTKIPDAESKYQLDLVITIKEKEPGNTPYFGVIQVVGFFNVDKGLSKEDISVLMHTRGGKILYSAAREFVLQLTSRGPWGSILLPDLGDPEESDIEDMKAEASKF
ncbi:MAG: protein-export chaperone SecB [Bacteroidales bacterium]|nr:protein-export chaperone SecB [Bacteroidales bacterium]